VSDSPQYSGTPWWGWLIIVVAAAMLVGVVLKAVSTGGSP